MEKLISSSCLSAGFQALNVPLTFLKVEVLLYFQMSSTSPPVINSNTSYVARVNGHPNGKEMTGFPQKNMNSQLMQAGNFPSKMILDDLMLSQGSLRNEVLRNDETLQAVRQENIMLAEKVQHATNLYRQLLSMHIDLL